MSSKINQYKTKPIIPLHNSHSSKNFSINPQNLFFKPKQKSINKNPKNNTENIDQYYFDGKLLGRGAFAKVELATHKLTKEKVAIKIVKKDKLNDIEKIRLNREIKILKLMHHNNIVHFYNSISTSNLVYIIMEYINGKDLFSYIIQKKKLPEYEACHFFQQIIFSIEYIEKLKIVHRDIKPENLLINSQNNIKLIDFGLSNFYTPLKKFLISRCGSPCYAAPEMILKEGYKGSGVDIWSVGIVLFAMLCGTLPFHDENETKQYQKIIRGKFRCPLSLSKFAKHLIENILKTDPKERYTISQIKKHPWFNMNKANINIKHGILINQIIIPINENVIEFMVKKYGFNELKIRNDISKNKHNNMTTIYYLLLKNEIKNNKDDHCNFNSNAFLKYIMDKNNLLKNYNNDINEVCINRIFGNYIIKKNYSNTNSKGQIQEVDKIVIINSKDIKNKRHILKKLYKPKKIRIKNNSTIRKNPVIDTENIENRVRHFSQITKHKKNIDSNNQSNYKINSNNNTIIVNNDYNYLTIKQSKEKINVIRNKKSKKVISKKVSKIIFTENNNDNITKINRKLFRINSGNIYNTEINGNDIKQNNEATIGKQLLSENNPFLIDEPNNNSHKFIFNSGNISTINNNNTKKIKIIKKEKKIKKNSFIEENNNNELYKKTNINKNGLNTMRYSNNENKKTEVKIKEKKFADGLYNIDNYKNKINSLFRLNKKQEKIVTKKKGFGKRSNVINKSALDLDLKKNKNLVNSFYQETLSKGNILKNNKKNKIIKI